MEKYLHESYPDFLLFDLDDLRRRETYFTEKMCREFPVICLEHFPELMDRRRDIHPTLRKLVQSVAEEAHHSFILTTHQMRKGLCCKVVPAPKPDSPAQSPSGLPFGQHTELSETGFKLRLHRKIKELLVEFYPEITGFTSYGFLQIDSLLYWECIDRIFYDRFIAIKDSAEVLREMPV